MRVRRPGISLCPIQVLQHSPQHNQPLQVPYLYSVCVIVTIKKYKVKFKMRNRNHTSCACDLVNTSSLCKNYFHHQFYFSIAEEQLSKRCPCGNCNAFDRVPSRDVTCIRDTSNIRDEGSSREGCILLSSWMPDDIEVNLRDELCENLIWRYDSVDFSYKSPKVSEKVLSHNTSRPYSRYPLFLLAL